MRHLFITISILFFVNCVVRGAIPTAIQLEWADWEIGAMISWGMETSAYNVSDTGFCHRNTGNWIPPATWYQPQFLDTDQWAEAIASFGGKYAVFTAKHCSGFALWPTKVAGYDYNVASSDYKEDVVMKVIQSLIKYGIKPGIYYGIGYNWYLNIYNGVPVNNNYTLLPGQRNVTEQEYHDIVIEQLTELWSNYGELAEVWFDGGVFLDSPDLGKLLTSLQPQTVAFQGPATFANNIRWVSNENADPPYPFWSSANSSDDYSGGSIDGPVWAPGESDTTIRANPGAWFWTPEYYLYGIKNASTLFAEYENAVGRNTNFMLNLSPDPFGLVPWEDFNTYPQFKAAVDKCYGKGIIETSGTGYNFTLDLGGNGQAINRIVMQEDQTRGQFIHQYELMGSVDNQNWMWLANGTSIGHKRIEVLSKNTNIRYVHLSLKAQSTPTIGRFALFLCD